ncbi:MAG: class I SAM-dependent methyltransferase [Blastocatellia bacterium]|nr:class I SAM-dependent methyltransferase [Blastocatellia bacterium]
MRERETTVWLDALLLPGETDPVESGLRELAEYFGISREEARAGCESSLVDSRREWEASRRETTEEIVDFYRHTRSYLFEHVWWHATDPEANAANVALMKYALARGARDYLDFGSGVGANAILYARHGFRVTLADVSETMLAFARWRLQRRGIEADYLDLNRQALPAGRFDFVSAVDVCEHLADPGVEFRRISAAMRPGGTFAFNYRAGEDEERPMHILPTAAAVLRSIRRSGFREAATAEADSLRRREFCVVERSAGSGLRDRLCGLYDGARYSRFFMPERIQTAGHDSRAAVRHPHRVYFEEIARRLTPGTRWLDLGCGERIVPWWLKEGEALEASLRARAGWIAGLDADFAPLCGNRSFDATMQARAEAIPVAEAAFDLVTANMLFQHIESPPVVLREIRRVLRPGGRLLALTPNGRDLFTMASRLTPASLQSSLVSRMETGREAGDHRTWLRFNRPRTIERFLIEAGFHRIRVLALDQPDAYSHVPILSRIESAWHRMARRRPGMRGQLLIEAELRPDA